MTADLLVLANGQEMGRVTCGATIKLAFVYSDTWRNAANAFPLSLSMPLAAARHDHKVVDPFLWGLLPDNEYVLKKWAAKYHVSPRNVFALVSHVGEDCAGAVQFVTPERLEQFSITGNVEWLDDAEIEARLTALREDHATGRQPRDKGQFSLAGAQPKTALIFQNGKWGIPSGIIPTTHILKPPTGDFDGFAENEYFCMELARAAGLNTANVGVRTFGNEVAFVTERYDRAYQDDTLIRVHQEDLCQALAVSPFTKYQNEGGPDVGNIVQLLRDSSDDAVADIGNFLKTIAFNWIIAGTDAHAKNFSMLLGAGGRARLAPLYDLSSALPYDDMQFQKLTLAMKIGGKYRLRDIGLRQWQTLETEMALDEGTLIEQVKSMAAPLADLAANTANNAHKCGITHPMIERIRERIAERAALCAKALT